MRDKSSVDMSKARAVQALLIAISTLPSQAPSMRICASRLPPESATAMLYGILISAALRSPASRMRRPPARSSDEVCRVMLIPTFDVARLITSQAPPCLDCTLVSVAQPTGSTATAQLAAVKCIPRIRERLLAPEHYTQSQQSRCCAVGDRVADDIDAGKAPYGFLDGDNEMARLILAHDWSGDLGPIADWPASLRTTVGLMLRSPVPLVVLWGPVGIMLYNDAYG